MVEISLNPDSYTCPVCTTKVQIILDGKIRSCSCKKMSIDCTPEYTRFIGYLPMEDPSYDVWYTQFKKTIDILREQYKNKIVCKLATESQ